MKNREFKILICVCAAVSCISAAVCAFISPACAVICFLCCAVVSGVCIFYTHKRYCDVAKLNDYLTRVCSGEYELELSDNTEGELSILKNNLYKMMTMLRKASEDAKKDKLYLADSLADISHQLKTPLTSMMIITEVLSDEQDADKRAGFIKIIEEQLEKMKWLITTLLKLSKLDAGTAEMANSPISAQALIDKSLTPFKLQIDIRNIRVERNDDDFIFTGDENWSAEALENIIKNCLEHIEDCGVLKITAACTRVYDEIIIEDNGCGIAKEDLPHIFERFYHGKNSSSESVGIGLALSKAVFERQSADISVSSKEGSGSRFTIRFYKLNV